jgi:hypothetical protein
VERTEHRKVARSEHVQAGVGKPDEHLALERARGAE